jgi:hypothetical protein
MPTIDLPDVLRGWILPEVFIPFTIAIIAFISWRSRRKP